MRIGLSIDDDVLAEVRELADAHGVSVGVMVTDLLRQAVRPTSRLTSGADGLPVVTVPDGARAITDEDVAGALAEP